VDAPGRVIGQAGEHVGEPGLGIDVVELGGLCRSPNYAERARFPQDSLRPAPLHRRPVARLDELLPPLGAVIGSA
jgi:hypothetical protein